MGSEDWYRNIRWDAEIEAAFNKKLGRSRSQKAQYLRIQGSILKDTHPHVAIALLQRCIDEGDEFHIAHAHLDTAHAHYVSGDVTSALDSLGSAIEQQGRQPMYRTSAAYDYAFIVALHGRVDLYDKALALLQGAADASFPSIVFEAETARALIFDSRGQDAEAQQAARTALSAEAVEASWIPGHPDVGLVPKIETSLHHRLRKIAGLDQDFPTP